VLASFVATFDFQGLPGCRVSFRGVREVTKLIAFAAEFADAKEFGTDVECGKVGSEADLGYGLMAVMGSRPGTVRKHAEGIDEGAGEKARGARLGEDGTDVSDEDSAKVVSGMGFSGELVEGVEDALGPVAADDLGDGKEGTPVVGQAVVGGHRRVARGNGVEVVQGPAGDFACEDVFDVQFAFVEAELE